MITEFKVIKPFSCAKVGDIFTWDKEANMYISSYGQTGEGLEMTSYISLSEAVMQQYVKSNLVEAVNDDKESNNNSKVKKLTQEIARLKNTYNQRNEATQKRYNDGKLPTCQKVEHDTVYFNMMKLLNRFEDIINE